MASSVIYDVAVIGAGVIGSAAAYQIVKTGATVVLLEQVQCVCTVRTLKNTTISTCTYKAIYYIERMIISGSQ